jgi:hypothetical protein
MTGDGFVLLNIRRRLVWHCRRAQTRIYLTRDFLDGPKPKKRLP